MSDKVIEPFNVFLGSFAAYGTGLVGLALMVTFDLAQRDPAAFLAAWLGILVLGGIYGLLVYVPALLAAFATFGLCRLFLSRIVWWQCVSLTIVWSVAVLGTLSGEIGFLPVIAGFGAIVGLAFWLGAAGLVWSANLYQPAAAPDEMIP